MFGKIIFFSIDPLFHDSRANNIAATLSEDGFEVVYVCRSKSSTNEATFTITQGQCKMVGVNLWSQRLPKNELFLPIKYIELISRAWQWIIEYNPDVCYAYDLPSLPLMWIIAKKKAKRLIYDAPELYFDRPFVHFRRLWKFLQKLFGNAADVVLTANEARAEIMHNEYGIASLPLVIHNYPPYQAINESNLLLDYVHGNGLKWSHVILHQGHVKEDRAAKQIVQSLKYIDPAAGVVFLGSIAEDYKEYLLELANLEGVFTRVLFHPPVSLDVLPHYTSSAKIGLTLYLNTSRNNYYCAPNKLYAYAMAGIPVVGSAFPGLTQDIEKNRIGFVVDPDNPNEIADAINRLLSENDLYQEMASNAKNMAREVWNWDKEKVRLRDIYPKITQEGWG